MNILKRLINGNVPLGGCINRSQRCASIEISKK
ncbi:hypothetical protein Ferpe_0721 [Fervidobacterium pennivorans DSM 9078]|jgi:hypothetical protein|uniref:Uncharacterized protein n=1 Tax=Fervidobacterium pennivorans (strain DSM 9078 / Ven5) TaxID=771875 RepID=G6HXH0_FERPD|nr:hypothetical protein Ferpe_0677 [Fervidobacterium pennivorans DSM 9078]AFG34843.1 hypothetical protein Ferpe_0721 [Fervidobacterium pennivorans DSM 9078]